MSQVNPSPQMRQLALVAVFAGGIAIGGSPIFVRLSEIGPIATAFWRLAIALVPLILFGLFTGAGAKGMLPQKRADLSILVLPGAFLAADLICWHLSIKMTSIANATLLINLSPVFVALVMAAFFAQPLTRNFVIGLLLALAGVVVLKGGGFGGGHLAGDLIAIAGAVFYAGYMIALGQARLTHGTLKVMLWNTASAAAFILPVALVSEARLFPETAYGWAILTGLSMASHVGGQAMIIFALAYLPTAFSSLTLLMQPVVATLLGYLLLKEPVGAGEILGGMLVLSGILVARRTGKPA